MECKHSHIPAPIAPLAGRHRKRPRDTLTPKRPVATVPCVPGRVLARAAAQVVILVIAVFYHVWHPGRHWLDRVEKNVPVGEQAMGVAHGFTHKHKHKHKHKHTHTLTHSLSRSQPKAGYHRRANGPAHRRAQARTT